MIVLTFGLHCRYCFAGTKWGVWREGTRPTVGGGVGREGVGGCPKLFHYLVLLKYKSPVLLTLWARCINMFFNGEINGIRTSVGVKCRSKVLPSFIIDLITITALVITISVKWSMKEYIFKKISNGNGLHPKHALNAAHDPTSQTYLF